jgi:hypothetical protein
MMECSLAKHHQRRRLILKITYLHFDLGGISALLVILDFI